MVRIGPMVRIRTTIAAMTYRHTHLKSFCRAHYRGVYNCTMYSLMPRKVRAPPGQGPLQQILCNLVIRPRLEAGKISVNDGKLLELQPPEHDPAPGVVVLPGRLHDNFLLLQVAAFLQPYARVISLLQMLRDDRLRHPADLKQWQAYVRLSQHHIDPISYIYTMTKKSVCTLLFLYPSVERPSLRFYFVENIPLCSRGAVTQDPSLLQP